MPLFEREYLTGSFYLYHSSLVIVAQPLSLALAREEKMKQYKCELCYDTGWYGDNGPGIKGNKEYQRCECMTETKTTICPICKGRERNGKKWGQVYY